MITNLYLKDSNFLFNLSLLGTLSSISKAYGDINKVSNKTKSLNKSIMSKYFYFDF